MVHTKISHPNTFDNKFKTIIMTNFLHKLVVF
jgi:hypothetical protein